jgi:hypothetical protein
MCSYNGTVTLPTTALPVDPTTIVPGAPLPEAVPQSNGFTIPRTQSGAEGCT